MKVALDAMGGDYGPKITVKGAVNALEEMKDLEVKLIGDSSKINEELMKYDYDKNRLEIIHTDKKIDINEGDSISREVRKNPKASMNIALQMVKDGKADGSVSAGNTGALMTSSLFTLKRVKGVIRPAITTVFPAKGGNVILLDAGANSDCKPEYLEQFSRMGKIYAETLFNKKRPRVALLNIGEEPGKGNKLKVATHKLLKKNKNINFVGNIEGRDIFSGKVDIVVTDGFTGNIVLKTTEGIATFIMELLKEKIKDSIWAKIGAIFMKPALRKLKQEMDYSEYGGAIFMGVNGVSIKAHGSSNALAIKNGIKVAYNFSKKDFIKKLTKELEQ